MVNYTERIALLMEDICRRTSRLSFINLKEVLVFGRFGRSDAEGAFATCHCLTLPESEPGYYFWRDRSTGELTRRSEWFVTKSPEVRIGTTRIKYLISFVLPRFCDQTLERSRKADLYAAGTSPWIAKLDTVVHELYHIDPEGHGLRRAVLPDGNISSRLHGPSFYEDVSRMVREYLATGPDAETFEFLRYNFAGLTERYGEVVCTTFRNYPSFPQRYNETVALPADEGLRIERMKPASQPAQYTERDLAQRLFTPEASRRANLEDAARA
jgi:hypothetical protein